MSLNLVSDEEEYSSDEIHTEDESFDYADYPNGEVYQDSDINNMFSVLQDQAYSQPKNGVTEDPHFPIG